MLTLSRWLLVACAFSCPLFYGWVSVGGTRLAAVDLLLAPLLVLVVLNLAQVKNNLIFLWAAMYVAAAFISLSSVFQDPLFSSTLLKTMRLAGIFLPAMLVALLPSQAVPIRAILWAFVAGGAASVLYGVAAFHLQLEAGTAVQMYYYDNYSYLRRAGGVFRDSGAFAHLLATWFAATVLALDLNPRLRLSWKVPVLTSTGVLTVIGLHASLSRSAMVNSAVVIAALALPHDPKRATSARIVWIVLLVAALAGGIAILGTPAGGVTSIASAPLQRIWETTTSFSEGLESLNWSAGGRLTGWARGLSIWSDQPIFGVGYKTLLAKHGVYSDNNYVLALVETGIVGGCGLIAVVCVCTLGFLRLYLAGVPASRTALALWCGQVVHGLTADIFTFMGSMPIVLILAFYCYRTSSIHESWLAVKMINGNFFQARWAGRGNPAFKAPGV